MKIKKRFHENIFKANPIISLKCTIHFCAKTSGQISVGKRKVRTYRVQQVVRLYLLFTSLTSTDWNRCLINATDISTVVSGNTTIAG